MKKLSETDMSSFLNRIKITNEFTQMLIPFLTSHGFVVSEFGYEQILRDNASMRALIKREKFKKSTAALMVKFSPDLICVFPQMKSDKGIFFLDVKTSITPVFFRRHIERLRRIARLRKLRREDIGEIEREAWDVYNTFYPRKRVAIVMACPYHPRLIVSEWVSNIFCFYRLNVDRNIEAGGSGTPHVNIHLGKMRTLSDFLRDEFRIRVKRTEYRKMLNFVKTWQLYKPAGRVNWTQFNNAINELKKTCPWLKNRWPEK